MGYTVKNTNVKKDLKVKVKPKKTKKEVKKKEETKEVKTSYFHQVKVELSKVKWPSFKDVSKYTLATIVFCLFLGLFFEGLNLLESFIKGLFS